MLTRRYLLAAAGLVAAMLLFAQPNSVHELTILHVNDLHARLTPDADGKGGFAHLATALKRERAAAKASLTLHAGDLVQGTPVSTLFQGVPVFEVANGLGIDVNCLGNHEFDYGWQKIAEFMSVAKFPTVNANLVDAAGKRFGEPYVIREAGGLRIAVIGAILERVADTLRLESLGPWHAAPNVETLRPIVAEARKDADMIIVLGHIQNTEAEAILRALPDVAVVVVGHDHSPWERPVVVGGRVAVHAEGYGRQLGRLELRYDKAARRIVSYNWTGLRVDARVYPADPEIQKVVDQWESKVSAVVDVPIGRASVRLSTDDVRGLLERAMLERTKSDIAFMNRGGVRDIIPQGELLARHIWTVMPFDNRVMIVQALGKDLADVMAGESTQASKLDPNRTYRLATIDFLTDTWADRGKKFRATDTGLLLRDVMIDWIRQRKQIP